MITCDYILGLLATSAGTYFWLWYLTYEAEVYSGRRKRTAWWEYDLTKLFKGKR